ncbi:glycosyltransferase involved in cell wall biosynthesis [Flavobacterium sp. 103]|uniref:glycosyltransferase family 4 protein n=1 Tax=unclassified Flavobacterium TaxID=196869 RepID=UPI000D5F17E7|nr:MULTISPECIES: glycosyltransferase family 4 protein [unclassified Flavobacterium]PVX46624.1 glycosyltransferase involved in cell wall biosynthesis [Flavobacterium sp. 103]QKJ64798.1 glycosyltransferase family 4 protein [Flavobacterium sp. M31R6]
MTKVILLSQVPLPFSKIGSWTTLYKNYLQKEHQVDFIVCEPPEKQFENVAYSLIANGLLFKIRRKVKKNKYLGYFEALDKILKPNEKYIIQIIDNFGIVKPLTAFLVSKGLRSNSCLQFFYHGFPPFYENYNGRWFFESIDEMVLLTNDSYLAHKNYYTVLPTRFSVLHNGIDTKKFFPLSLKEKQAIKQTKNTNDKTVFVWCSQDRPKKGLSILLEAWKRVYKTRQDIVLWVIGCEPKTPQDGVMYLGRIPNDELPVYFQSSDCYLFPTLCHEGFGMSLIEALHCGNYCIASAIGGVPEVLQYGKLGKLIENPHFVSAWEKAINEFLEGKFEIPELSNELYSTEMWNLGMNKIIIEAKNRLAQ